MSTTVQQSLFARSSAVILPLQKEINMSLVFMCQSALLSVVLDAVLMYVMYTKAASFELFCKMCLFLFVTQRIEAFLLVHSSWFKQAHFKCSLTA